MTRLRYHALPEHRQAELTKLCDSLGLRPNEVAADSEVTNVDGQQRLKLRVYILDDDGHKVAVGSGDDREVASRLVTVPLAECPHWLAGYITPWPLRV